MADRTPETGNRSIRRLGAIINLLRDEEPLTTREVADRLGVAKSTAHSYLSSMRELEYVVGGRDGYSLSLKFLDYGMAERNRSPVARNGGDTVERLATDTSEAAYLIVEEHGVAVYVDAALGDRAVKTHARVGTRASLHSLASGRAILAHLSGRRVDEIVERHGLRKRTEHTIDTPERLHEDLRSIREQGYAINEHEAVVGARAVGVPVLVDGEVLGAVSVAGPANRITTQRIEETILEEVFAAANEIELKIAQGAHGAPRPSPRTTARSGDRTGRWTDGAREERG